jgi:hypothetical protein
MSVFVCVCVCICGVCMCVCMFCLCCVYVVCMYVVVCYVYIICCVFVCQRDTHSFSFYLLTLFAFTVIPSLLKLKIVFSIYLLLKKCR